MSLTGSIIVAVRTSKTQDSIEAPFSSRQAKLAKTSPKQPIAKDILVKIDHLDVFVLDQQAGGEERPKKRGSGGRVNISIIS